jgi:uncharacterized membrane protein YphA (DoxX/SURF4 family)
MKLTEPLAAAGWGPLWIRLALGSYFTLAGVEKIDKIPAFVQEVQNFDILPTQLGVLYGVLLPYFEIVVGLMLILGVWATLTAMLASAMLISFIFAFGIFPRTYMFFNKDLILLAASFSLLFTGAGAASIDNFRR